MRTCILLIAVITLSTAASKKDNPSRADQIIGTRDEPLQITWFQHKKIPWTHSHEGLFKADTYSWQCYPTIAQTFKRDKKGLLWNLTFDGAQDYGVTRSVVVTVDGELIELPEIDWKSFRGLGGTDVLKASLTGQEILIRKIAGAKEVWITILGSPRHSIKLSEQQVQIFA